MFIRLTAAGKKPRYRNLGRPLGTSFVGEQGGNYGVVFLDKTRNSASIMGISVNRVTDYAIAHEVGHLLLGRDHTTQGLMKPDWDIKDFLAMSRDELHFSGEQVRKLQKLYGVRPGEQIPSNGSPGEDSHPSGAAK